MTFDDVAEIIADLPEVTVGLRFGRRTWFAGKTGFAWERPFSKADLKRFGDVTPPSGPILAIRVAGLEEKEVMLQTRGPAFFTIEHFRGFPGLLIQLERVSRSGLREALLDAWMACAPPAVVRGYLKPDG
jgi:hypothetical protein